MRRRGGASIAANPVLIGAATTLVVIVAVFLAYNANNGLPFVPTYELKAEVPNAANLVVGNDVRLGGARVGVVDKISPKENADGSVTAILDLKLQTNVKPLPKDSTLIIRPRSALGLKYVEITLGNARNAAGGFADGATIPLANARPAPVEFDEVINMFDEPVRAASRVNLVELGNGLAGRGQNLNDAIKGLNPLLEELTPVMENLSSRQTNLSRFVSELADTVSIIAPVAETQADLFVNLDTTFAALAEVSPFIQQTLEGGPPALQEGIDSFPVPRPFLANTEQLMRDLRPGVAALRDAAPALSEALTAGTPALRRSVSLNSQLSATFRTLRAFSNSPEVPIGLSVLTRTVELLDPTLATLRPTQVQCNYITLFFRNTASLLSEGTDLGTWQRFIIVAAPQGPNNEGGPSTGPANGPDEENHLHSNPYPNVGAPGTTDECEAGNEGYIPGETVVGNVPGSQGKETENTTPGPLG